MKQVKNLVEGLLVIQKWNINDETSWEYIMVYRVQSHEQNQW